VPTEEFRFGEFRLDFRKQELFRGVTPVELTVKEFEVLQFLIKHEGEVVTREALLNSIWGYEHFPTTRTVDNCILSLRKKLDPDRSAPKHILTVHTAGYKFKA
jgi:two-component system, OmpR family, alkaline phosphatase synthesis response regulator PhoP